MAAVLVPERVEGKHERLCWERHARDLKLAYPRAGGDPQKTRHPKGYWFDAEAAERPVRTIEAFCKHHKGEWAGKPLLLEEWQKRLIRIAFGWMRPDGTRRFRILYIEVPRKNGKSEIGAALGLYLLVADHEPGAEIYSSATKKDQAKIVHDTAVAMVKASPELKKWVRSYRNNLHCVRLGSKFEPLGADSSTLDGLNPHGNIVDELHAHRDRGVWDVLDTAMGARRQPMTIAITTAGVYEPESIGWQQHEHAQKVLEGVIEDDAYCAYIAAAPEDADWTLPETWATANPNLGVSVKPDYLAEQCEKAKAQPSFLNTFLRLHLNRWTSQQDRWLAMEHWNACDQDLTPVEAAERESRLAGAVAFAGLDLASKVDIAAFVLALPREDDVVELVCRFWVPEEKVVERSRRDRVPYDAWVREGWLTATPGNVIDYEFIRAEMNRLSGQYDLREVGFDPWNATQLATQLSEDGFTMVEVRQGFRSLSEPAKALEARIMAKQIRHAGHPVLRWMVSNVATREDPNGNIAPDKSASSEKIDGVVATIMAFSRLIVAPDFQSVYEERGPLWL